MLKKSFTILELLVVILLIWMLFVIMWWLFKPDNRSKIYSEICINNIYGDIRWYINKALNSKSLSFSWENYNPDSYKIEINSWENYIFFWFELGWTWYEYKKVYLSWDIWSIKECEDKNYSVKLSWNIDWIYIFKKLDNNTRDRSFVINQNNWTWNIEFWLSEWWYDRLFWKVFVDGRIPNTFLDICKDFPLKDKSKQCQKRSMTN